MLKCVCNFCIKKCECCKKLDHCKICDKNNAYLKCFDLSSEKFTCPLYLQSILALYDLENRVFEDLSITSNSLLKEMNETSNKYLFGEFEKFFVKDSFYYSNNFSKLNK